MNFDPITHAAVQQLKTLIMTGISSESGVATLHSMLDTNVTGVSLEAILQTDAGRMGISAVAASSTAMAAVAASSTAMAAVWASNTASDAVLTNSASKLAIYNSDPSLSLLQANPTQVARQIGIGGRTSTGSTSTSAFTYVPNGTKVILLRAWTAGGNEDFSLRWGRGLTTDDVAGGVRLPNGDNLGVASVALGRTTTYANSGTYPSVNNNNANVVSAANGLRRGTWSIVGATTQNVTYITV